MINELIEVTDLHEVFNLLLNFEDIRIPWITDDNKCDPLELESWRKCSTIPSSESAAAPTSVAFHASSPNLVFTYALGVAPIGPR